MLDGLRVRYTRVCIPLLGRSSGYINCSEKGMNQTKNKYESLLTLHYKLCRYGVNELREIGKQISDVLQFVEKYKLFPVDLSEHFRDARGKMA